ncbi:putative Bardet-Biedl syndrome 5 protein [Paratrimastix pyriformis]|uniref:Bardet-Biedl syndrome 5 protein n=1 Tax=Paratrimastix pyriformis TaxID=342808 RepID=A0ABQ8UEG5_9EUKA|nr:putative Bardet-Biedl syndrome 5 protein [Paratrimastix pyriformis]|eukprot:GAFH01002332.1.p1 GENE.GAFH01002332.1~~GAFH01002332.1.p1  ORF type:complete len:363 (-),score=132.75 GAFH01002332.1:98-1186(-)
MATPVWQDREIRFDVALSMLALRRGEFQIDWMNSIEDTKGNNGEKGVFIVTNLRMIWYSHKNQRTNLSIGYDCIKDLSIRSTNSMLRGNAQGLFVLGKFDNNKYEFIFTNCVKGSPRLFTTVQAVFRAYETTRLYRDLRLRGAIIREGELKLLPNEQIYTKTGGVWNLSHNQGHLGSLYTTNIRVVWYANMAPNFNVSIPYLQLRTVGVRDSPRFGVALVLTTSKETGGYVLGFRVDPPERLKPIATEIEQLHQLFTAQPNFGVDFKLDEKPQPLAELRVPRVEEDTTLAPDEAPDVLASYYMEIANHRDRAPVLSPELGLAVEQVAGSFSLQQLWAVLPPDPQAQLPLGAAPPAPTATATQ